MRIRSRHRATGQEPLEPAAEAMAAIRSAEKAAAARRAAEAADQAGRDGAEKSAAALLADASARAAQRAEQRRLDVRAGVDRAVETVDTAAAAEVSRIERAAADRHDVAVQQAVRFVLTGEAPCSSR